MHLAESMRRKSNVMKHSRKSHPSKLFDSCKAARSWLELGIQPVPLHSRSKKPKQGKGWQKLLVEEETIEQFFERGDNLGGLWGEPSGWIVDIDLDCDEAIAAADVLLPETFIYGRRTRPASHYLYRCEGITTFKRFPFKGEMILECRSTGAQSVLPPSIHPDGDRYEINNDVPFKTLSRRELERRCNLIAAASLLAQRYPESGSRHDYIHAVAGSLLWEGWSPESVNEFMGAVLDAADRKEDDRPQRERTVANTIDHFAKGDRVSGWRTLSQWIAGEDLKAIRLWLNSGRKMEDPPTKKRAERAEEDTGPKPELLQVPGLVGEIMDWAAKRAFAVQPLFDLAVGLMTVALASGNKYVVDGWDTPLQPYFLLLAPTASGKESGLGSVHHMTKTLGIAGNVFQGFQSYHALLDKLTEPPHLACWLWDEAARKLRAAGRTQGGQDSQIVTYLLSLYGKAAASVAGMPGRKASIDSVDHPFLTILAAAQPSQMIEALTESDISMGLINRFVLFDAGDELPDTNFGRQTIFPAKIDDGLKAFRSIEPPKGDFPFIKIRMSSTETWAIFRDFNEQSREFAVRGGGWEMWGRANQNALILAGIVAIGINARKPIITESIARWAIRFLEWSSNRWTSRVEESSARSTVEVASKYVEKAIRHAVNFKGRAFGRPGELRALERGLMPRALLIRLCRHLRGRDFDDSIDQLVASDLIVCGEIEGREVYWIRNSASNEPPPPRAARQSSV